MFNAGISTRKAGPRGIERPGGLMTGVIVTVGMVAAGIFGFGLLVGMGAGAFILRRAEDLGARRERMYRLARRLVS